jgi:hypothetical protein
MNELEKKDLKEFNAKKSLIDLYGEAFHNNRKIISYSNIIEEIIKLKKEISKYESAIDDLWYSANSLQSDAEGILDEISDLQETLK